MKCLPKISSVSSFVAGSSSIKFACWWKGARLPSKSWLFKSSRPFLGNTLSFLWFLFFLIAPVKWFMRSGGRWQAANHTPAGASVSHWKCYQTSYVSFMFHNFIVFQSNNHPWRLCGQWLFNMFTCYLRGVMLIAFLSSRKVQSIQQDFFFQLFSTGGYVVDVEADHNHQHA